MDVRDDIVGQLREVRARVRSREAELLRLTREAHELAVALATLRDEENRLLMDLLEAGGPPPMSHEGLMSASDIAEMAGVGRAAVSNWKQRHADFPTPAIPHAVNPLYPEAAVRLYLASRGIIPRDEATTQ